MATATEALQGRVFARRREFPSLPQEFQEDLAELEAYLTEKKGEIFGQHHATFVRTILSIRGRPLAQRIEAWLKARDAPPTEAASIEAAAAAAAADADAEADAEAEAEADAEEKKPAESPPAADEEPVVASPEAADKTEEPAEEAAVETPEATPEAATPATPPAPTGPTPREYAKKLIDGLVKAGFLTTNKDNAKAETRGHYRDLELYIPLAPGVTEITIPTVWSVVDGAVSAEFMKRKAGFLAPFRQGKDVYVVCNERLQALYLFESDVARAPLVEFAGSEATTVALDSTHFPFGVRLTNAQTTELLNARTKEGQEAFVKSLVDLGMKFQEPPVEVVEEKTAEAEAGVVETTEEAAVVEEKQEVTTEEVVVEETTEAVEVTTTTEEVVVAEEVTTTEEAVVATEVAVVEETTEAAVAETKSTEVSEAAEVVAEDRKTTVVVEEKTVDGVTTTTTTTTTVTTTKAATEAVEEKAAAAPVVTEDTKTETTTTTTTTTVAADTTTTTQAEPQAAAI